MTTIPRSASVVINNYNYCRFLRESIESALDQSHPATEVIVVDDGSTDDSRSVIEAYAGRVTTVFQPNSGQGAAINTGFRASSGEVVIFLDADDVLFPSAVEESVSALDEAATAKVQWPLIEVDRVGVPTGLIQPRSGLSAGDQRDVVIRQGPLAAKASPTSGNAWARWFLDQVLPMPEAPFRINSDAYLVTLAWVYGSVAVIDHPLGKYRIHGDNNFASLGAGARRERQYEMYIRRCEALADHLERLGIDADPEPWKLNGLFMWTERLRNAKAEVTAVIPPGSTFILVDEDGWGTGTPGRDPVPGRSALPFMERDGAYWGLPESSNAAITCLERLRSEGAGYIVFTWDTLWWLDTWPELAIHLNDRYRMLSDGALTKIYKLREAQEASATPGQPAAVE